MSNKCLKDLFRMLPIISQFPSECTNKLKPETLLKLYSKNIVTYRICDCFLILNTLQSLCPKCNEKPQNYFVESDIKSKIAYLEKKFVEKDFTSMSWVIFSDGISPFRKSNKSLWPIFLVSMNLDFKERFEIDNILILGIFYGSKKPEIQILLKHVFSKFLTSGEIIIHSDNKAFNLKIKAIVADKPARSMVLNMQNFNSRYGCPFCFTEIKTEIIHGSKHIFVPFSDSFKNVARTHAGVLACAYSATETGTPDYGVKGYSFLSNISSLDLVSSNCIDYMHSVCLGVFKSLCFLLFKNKNIPNCLRFNSKINEYDMCIKKLKYGQKISNEPMSLKKMANWQAKDYRNFFLHIFPIIFLDHKDQPFFKCIMYLRDAIYILLDPSLNNNAVDQAESFIKEFRKSFQLLYGEHYATPNFHDLDHITECARKFGPIFQFSGFNFEHINGILKRLCKGNKRLDLQIIKKLEIFSDGLGTNTSSNEEITGFIDKIMSKNHWVNKYKLNSLISICGKITKVPDHDQLNSPGKFSCNRVLISKMKVSTYHYDQNKKKVYSVFLSENQKHCLIIMKIFFSKSTGNAFFEARKHNVDLIFNGIFKINPENCLIGGQLVDLYQSFEPCSTVEDFCIKSQFNECF